MPSLLRFLAFAGGMTVGFGGLALLNHFVPGVWMPVALIALLVGLFSREPWLRGAPGFLAPLSVAIGAGVMTGWMVTGDKFHWRTAVIGLLGFVAMGASAETLNAFRKLRSPVRRAAGWLLVASVCVWIVSAASSSYAAGGRMVDWLVHRMHLAPALAEHVVFWIRKSIHVCFYGSLGLSARNASLNGNRGFRPPAISNLEYWAAARFGFLTTLLVAAFDETRQTTQPGRTGSAYDVLLDVSGATVFLLIASAVQTALGKRRRMSE